jgi:hypothetical protein
MGEHGKLTGARVCQDCASDGVLVVAANPARRCRCGNPAVKCGACASESQTKEKVEVVRDAIKRLKVLLTANEAGKTPGLGAANDYRTGRSTGLESAIELLESGRF